MLHTWLKKFGLTLEEMKIVYHEEDINPVHNTYFRRDRYYSVAVINGVYYYFSDFVLPEINNIN